MDLLLLLCYWGLNSQSYTCWAGPSPLNYISTPAFIIITIIFILRQLRLALNSLLKLLTPVS